MFYLEDLDSGFVAEDYTAKLEREYMSITEDDWFVSDSYLQYLQEKEYEFTIGEAVVTLEEDSDYDN